MDDRLPQPTPHCFLNYDARAERGGLWFDRTNEYAARVRREDFDPLKYATVEILARAAIGADITAGRSAAGAAATYGLDTAA